MQPCNETFFDTKGWLFSPNFLLINQSSSSLFPLESLPPLHWVPWPGKPCTFYQFLQIPHSNKVLGLCCIESLCDKAELTSLIIVKVTFKKKLYNSYLFCSLYVWDGPHSFPSLVWGLFSWRNCSVAQGRLNFWKCSPDGLRVVVKKKNARME